MVLWLPSLTAHSRTLDQRFAHTSTHTLLFLKRPSSFSAPSSCFPAWDELFLRQVRAPSPLSTIEQRGLLPVRCLPFYQRTGQVFPHTGGEFPNCSSPHNLFLFLMAVLVFVTPICWGAAAKGARGAKLATLAPIDFRREHVMGGPTSLYSLFHFADVV